MRSVLGLGVLVTMMSSCVDSNSSRPPVQAQGQGNLYGPNGQPQPYPQQAYPQQVPPQQPYPQQRPQTQGPQPPNVPTQVQRPLLAPLVGIPAMQQEVRGILNELIRVLPAANQAKVTGIPLNFSDGNEINAYAGCDKGAAFMEGTQGFLLATDAIAQTRATDEMFGTRTYDAYTSRVIPEIMRDEKASPALPAGIIPAQYWANAGRFSRAREIFQDVVAFTFGHELGHHYLGHTGCATGAAQNGLSQLLNLASHVVPVWSQAYEAQADQGGTLSSLDAGRLRRPQFRWSEAGGVFLLDFFARLDQAAGGGVLHPLNLLASHPNPGLRIPYVQSVARDWYARNPL